jgi:hypothetical protein
VNDKSSGSLIVFNDSSGTISSPTTVTTFSSQTPDALSVSPGSTYGYVALSGTKTVDRVTLSGGSKTAITLASSFTAVGPIGLSGDGSTLVAADTGSATAQELGATLTTLTETPHSRSPKLPR